MISNHPTKLPNVLVTGTPGVGKTSFAMLLLDKLNEQMTLDEKYTYINIGKIIHDKHLYKEWDKKFDVPIFDDDMVLDEIEPIIMKGGVIIDFHSPDFIPEDWVDLIIVLCCDNTILYDRLKARGYSDEKTQENVTCEIMHEVSEGVKEYFPKTQTLELVSEQLEDMEKNMDLAMKAIDAIFTSKNN